MELTLEDLVQQAKYGNKKALEPRSQDNILTFMIKNYGLVNQDNPYYRFVPEFPRRNPSMHRA